MNAVTHPIDTAKYMWNGIETAWKRDVVNGNARSRSEFFSYAVVSIIGLKGFDKVGKLAKLDKVSKAKPALPYNVLNTEKLKGFIYNKVKTNFSNEKAKIVQSFKNKPVQITLNQAVRAVQNTKTLSTIKNVLNPIKLKKGFENTYRDIIRSPLAKTKSAIDWSIDRRIKKIGEVKVPTSFKVNQVEISGGFNFINVSTESAPLKDIVQKFSVKQESRNININGTKGAGEVVTTDIRPDFVGKLKGEEVKLPNVKTEKVMFNKRNLNDTAQLRKDFNMVRKVMMKSMADNPEKIKELKKAGISDNDIEDMMEFGLVPDGWQVHHKIPLDQGGTNNVENLVLPESVIKQ